MKHDLKILPEYFKAIMKGDKTFEIRKNDRCFQVGDVLRLRSHDPRKNEYTGEFVEVVVSYMSTYAQFPDYVVLGIKYGQTL